MSLLRDKRLLISSPALSAPSYAIQDGSDSAGVMQQWDNGFRDGCLPPGGRERDRFHVSIEELVSDYQTGRQLRFRVTGRKAWLGGRAAGLQLIQGSEIEFWAAAPTPDTDVATPGWHLNGQTGRTRLFRGWVDSVRLERNGFLVVARDALWRAKAVPVLLEFGDGTFLSRILINAKNSRENPDWLVSVKKVTDSPASFGYAVESQLADARMTVREILEWLEERSIDALVAAGAASLSGVFDASDLAALPDVKPGQIGLEDASFVAVVRSVLQWVPDFRLVVDPRSQKWRLVRFAAALTEDATTSVTVSTNATTAHGGGITSEAWLKVPDGEGAPFSDVVGADGHRVRIYDPEDPELSEEAVIALVDPAATGADVLYFLEPLSRTYPVGSTIAAVAGQALPTVTLNVDDVSPDGLQLERSLDGSFSAVAISSSQAEESRLFSARWSRDSVPQGVEPRWDPTFENVWRPSDEHREHDFGADSAEVGMRVYDVDTTGSQQKVLVKYSQSQHGADHANGEWAGSALWLFTSGGGTWRKAENVTALIANNTHVDDVGDGSPGLELLLGSGVDWATLVGEPFGTEVAPVAGVIDRVGITSSLAAGATVPNARWNVGRQWGFTQTIVSGGAGTLDLSRLQCKRITVNAPSDAVAAGRSFNAIPGHGGNPANTPSGVLRTEGQWDILAGGTGAIGELTVARLNFTTPRPLSAPGPGCAGQGWKAPPTVNVQIEVVDTNIRSARYPASGHAGVAWVFHRQPAERTITASDWIDDSQNADYEALVRALWNLSQDLDAQGAVTFPGVREHAVWMDLAVRAELRTSATQLDSGTMLQGFWGAVTAVRVDFRADTVSLDFSNRNPLRDVGIQFLEQVTVDQSARLARLEDEVSLAAQIARCTQANIPMGHPGVLCDSDVAVGHRPLGPVVRVPAKDNKANNAAPVALDMTDPSTGRSLTLGMRATRTVVLDALGQPFVIRPSGAIHPVSVAGTVATETPSSAVQFAGQPQVNRSAIMGLLGLFGATLEAPPDTLHTEVAAVSSSTRLVLGLTNLTTDAFAGGHLLLQDFDPLLPRELIPILENDASSVSLSIALSDTELPVPGAGVILVPAPKLRPSATDFPDGAFAFQDANGDWIAYDFGDGLVYAVGEAGGALVKIPATVSRELVMPGNLAANLNPTISFRGTVDFTDATVVGLP